MPTPLTFFVAKVFGGPIEHIKHFKPDAAATIVMGSAVVLAADGELEVCGADPTAILGVALGDKQQKAGWGMANAPTQVQHRDDTVGVAICGDDVTFGGPLKDGGGEYATPAASDIGLAYGIVIGTGGAWFVDKTDVVNTRVRVVDIDIPNKLVLFTVLPANRQLG